MVSMASVAYGECFQLGKKLVGECFLTTLFQRLLPFVRKKTFF